MYRNISKYLKPITSSVLFLCPMRYLFHHVTERRTFNTSRDSLYRNILSHPPCSNTIKEASRITFLQKLTISKLITGLARS
jgi:hypothetical protein